MIYAFDSSFPLMFQNNILYKNLNCNAKIIVGFPHNIITKYGTKGCYEVMKKRTVELIINIIELNLFEIKYHNIEKNVLNDVENIYRLVDEGFSLFSLRKIN